jgi:hypothetical protein
MSGTHLRRSMFAAATLATVWLSSPERAHSQDALFQRPTQVEATMANSNRYTGQYAGNQVARVCGETDPMQFFSGERAFLMEYPLDYDGVAEIVDVRFHSKTLVAGATETDKFYVSINVKSDLGGQPPAYVVDTERPTPNQSGHAWLERSGGTERIRVEAVNELGETLKLTFHCAPRG